MRNGAWSVTRSIHYAWDGWKLAAECERDGAGTVTAVRSFVWGPDIEGQKTGSLESGAGGIGGLLAVTVTSNGVDRVYLPLTDGLGNVRGLVDAQTGALAAEYAYDPYGVPLEVGGDAADLCPFRFQTKYWDSETGLYYFGFRYYDPLSCKWLCRDPKGEAGGVNLTCYCGNDPVNGHDPWGLEMSETENGGILPSGYVKYIVTDANPLSGDPRDVAEYLYVGLANWGNLVGNLAIGSVTELHNALEVNINDPGAEWAVGFAPVASPLATFGAAEQGVAAIGGRAIGALRVSLAKTHSVSGLAKETIVSENPLFVYDRLTQRFRNTTTGRFTAQRNLPYPSKPFLTQQRVTLPKGLIIDRFGNPSGRFAGTPGATISERGMPPGSEMLKYRRYRVAKPFEAVVGPASPVREFDADGGSIQYLFDDTIEYLKRMGFLEELP